MSMRKPGTTPRPNRAPARALTPVFFIAAVGLVLAHSALAQGTAAPAGNQASPQASSTSSPAQTQDSQQLPPEALGPSTNPPPPLPVFTPSSSTAPGDKPGGPNNGSGPAATENGIYIYHAEAREVFLHATVSDDRNRL